VVTLAAQHGDVAADASCEDAVKAFVGGLPRSARDELRGEGPYEAEDVDLDSVDDDSRNIRVPCIGDDDNAWSAFHESDGSWTLITPFCSAG